jgi:hypothetical protein
MHIKRYKKSPDLKARRSPNNNAEPKQRVISYYTASRHQLDNFERQAGAYSKEQRLGKPLGWLRQWWFWLVSGCAILVMLGYLVSLSSMPYIVISGPSYRSKSAYQKLIEPELKNNFFNRFKPLLNTSNLQSKLSQLIPEARTISVGTSWLGHHPIIKIDANNPLAIFSQKDQPDRLLSDRGKVLIDVAQSQIDSRQLPLLQNDSGVTVQIGEQFISPEQAEAVGRLNNQFKAENAVVTYTLSNIPNELIVQESGRGYRDRFLLNDQIVTQFGALRATEKKLAEINQQPTSYIDVRLSDKVYYK